MRRSKILAKIRSKQPVRLAMLSHYMPAFVAQAAHQGFDGIWLEMEHRAMDVREVQALLGFFHLYDIDCVLRPATREKAQLARFLEDGANGLMMPHVSDAETARDLVSKVKFPPIGDRGIEGRNLESNFMTDTDGDWHPLVEHARIETFLAVQIETPQALANLEEIAAVPGLDMLFVGPADLTLRMEQLPPEERVSLHEVYERVAAVCRQHGLAWGSMPAKPQQVRELVSLGAQLLVWGVDVKLIAEGLRHASTLLDDMITEVAES